MVVPCVVDTSIIQFGCINPSSLMVNVCSGLGGVVVVVRLFPAAARHGSRRNADLEMRVAGTAVRSFPPRQRSAVRQCFVCGPPEGANKNFRSAVFEHIKIFL